MVERLFLTVPRGCLQFVIVVFPDHTHLLFFLVYIGNIIWIVLSMCLFRILSAPGLLLFFKFSTAVNVSLSVIGLFISMFICTIALLWIRVFLV